MNVDRLLPSAWELYEKATGRIPTSRLNQLVESIVSRNPPPSMGRGNFNILYASQVKAAPPTFVLFVNRKHSLPASYQRYLSETLRGALELKGQSLRIFFREARGRGKKPGGQKHPRS
jgi:GTP-binding protein